MTYARKIGSLSARVQATGAYVPGGIGNTFTFRRPAFRHVWRCTPSENIELIFLFLKSLILWVNARIQ